MPSCLVVDGIFPNTRVTLVWSQGNLFGGVMLVRLLLRTMYSGIHACRSFHLLRCFANGSSKRIVAISVH